MSSLFYFNDKVEKLLLVILTWNLLPNQSNATTTKREKSTYIFLYTKQTQMNREAVDFKGEEALEGTKF